MAICDKDTTKLIFRIDVEYDEGSFNALYSITEKDEYSAKMLVDFFEITRESEIYK